MCNSRPSEILTIPSNAYEDGTQSRRLHGYHVFQSHLAINFRSLCAVEQHEELRAVCGGSDDSGDDGLEASDVDSTDTVAITGHELLR